MFVCVCVCVCVCVRARVGWGRIKTGRLQEQKRERERERERQRQRQRERERKRGGESEAEQERADSMCAGTVSGWGKGDRSRCISGLPERSERSSAGWPIWKQPDLSPGSFVSASPEPLCPHTAGLSDLFHQTWRCTSLVLKPEELVGLERGEGLVEISWGPGAPWS